MNFDILKLKVFELWNSIIVICAFISPIFLSLRTGGDYCIGIVILAYACDRERIHNNST